MMLKQSCRHVKLSIYIGVTFYRLDSVTLSTKNWCKVFERRILNEFRTYKMVDFCEKVFGIIRTLLKDDVLVKSIKS